MKLVKGSLYDSSECTLPPKPKFCKSRSPKNPRRRLKLPFCYSKAISSSVRQAGQSISQKTRYPSANWFARDLEEKALPFSLQLHDTDCVSAWGCQYIQPCWLINILISKGGNFNQIALLSLLLVAFYHFNSAHKFVYQEKVCSVITVELFFSCLFYICRVELHVSTWVLPCATVIHQSASEKGFAAAALELGAKLFERIKWVSPFILFYCKQISWKDQHQ